MKYFILVFLSIIYMSTYSQSEDNSDFVFESELFGKLLLTPTPDTLVTGGGVFPVIIVGENSEYVSYYSFGDPAKKVRQMRNELISKVINNSFSRTFIDLNIEDLKGTKVLMEIVPFSPALSKYTHLKVDLGVGEYNGVLKVKDEPLRFISEFSAINFILSKGWELYKIETIEKGSFGGASSVGTKGALGGSIKFSSTRYIFTKEL